MVGVWRQLRRPFELPLGTGLHACEWEALDVDVLGCRVCGGVHACDVCTCLDVIETGESVVCALSGVVLRSQVYSEAEFVETVAMTGPISQFDEDIAAEVEQTVREMLVSASSRRHQRAALCEVLLRWARGAAQVAASAGATSAGATSMTTLCARLVRRAGLHAHAFAFVAAHRREALATAAAADCRRILRFMVTCGMPVKAAEVPRLTVGLLYLMRQGIASSGSVVLAARDEVAQLLPVEGTLARHYGIHPKFITETENRIKFCLRLRLE